MDIAVQYTNARINRMSRRRQKIALAKRSTKIFKNVWPKAVVYDDVPQSSMVTLSVSFNPQCTGEVA